MAIAALSGVVQGIHSKLTPQLSRRYGRPEGEGSSPSDCHPISINNNIYVSVNIGKVGEWLKPTDCKSVASGDR